MIFHNLRLLERKITLGNYGLSSLCTCIFGIDQYTFFWIGSGRTSLLQHFQVLLVMCTTKTLTSVLEISIHWLITCSWFRIIPRWTIQCVMNRMVVSNKFPEEKPPQSSPSKPELVDFVGSDYGNYIPPLADIYTFCLNRGQFLQGYSYMLSFFTSIKFLSII